MAGNNLLENLAGSFENRQQRLIAKTLQDIITLFEQKGNDLAFLYAKRKLIGNRFLPKDIRLTIERITNTINVRTYDILVNSIRQSFRNADSKNNLLEKQLQTSARRRPPGRGPSKLVSSGFSSEKQLTTAVNAFIKRKNEGLNLSNRVFKLSNQWKKTINDTMIDGLKEGTSARDLAKSLKGAVRNGYQQSPGRGVYKSPIKNAMRLTRNENNLAYANADYERWQQIDFIIGIEIRLSNRHPKFDMCDDLKGKYPKSFHYTKWHVNCLCVAIPVLASQQVRDEIMDYKLGLRDTYPSFERVEEIPSSAKNWIRKNADRVEGWNSKPYWVENNKAVFSQYKDPNSLKNLGSSKAIQENIDLARETKKDSLALYKDADGKLLPFRKQLHDDIIDDIVSKGSTDTGFVYMLGGAPANGKSTLVNSKLLPHPDGVLKIDPDEIKGKLPEYSHLVKQKDPRAAAFVHEESSLIGKKTVDKALRKNFDLLSDGVGDGSFDDLDKKLQKYRDAGKKLRADYVTLDTDLSLTLADLRAAKTGRQVPSQYILDMNREISKLVPQLIKAKSFDELYLWDTNLEGKPRLILSQVNGKLKIVDKALYNRFLKKANYGK